MPAGIWQSPGHPSPENKMSHTTHNAAHITGEAKATGSQEAQDWPLGKANLICPLGTGSVGPR